MTVSKLRDLFSSPRFVIAVFIFLILTGLAVLASRNALFVAGDAGTKLLQTQDFVAHDFKSFSCIYPGKSIDPEEEFFPFWAPFAYKLNGNCQYVFPVFLAAFNTPAFLLAKGAGFFLISALASIGIIFLVSGIGSTLNLNQRERAIVLWIAALGIGLPSYALNPNEPAISCFFSLLAVYYFLRETNTCYVLSGMAVGVGLLLRPDAVLTGAALGLSMLIFYRVPFSQKLGRLIRFSVPIVFFAGVLFLVNFALFGHPMGVRSHEVEGMETHVAVRLASLMSYLFGNSEAVFVRTPIFILAIFLCAALLLRNRSAIFSEITATPRVLTLILCVVIVIFVIPFLWTNPNHGGPRFGERHLFNAYPLLAILSGVFLTRVKLQIWPARILVVLVVASVVFTSRANLQGFKGSLNLQRVRALDSMALIKGTEPNAVVILRHFYLGDMIYASFLDRVYFVADNDAKFAKLEARLRSQGVRSYYVLHSRAPFRGTISDASGKEMHFPETMVPQGTFYKSVSDDRGTELWELRRYDL
ncbi:MAG: hypothetical protein K8S54_08455 [Spirochaetia bacterium]|nr:hypothetical protein [Spirochaetia bacterium]